MFLIDTVNIFSSRMLLVFGSVLKGLIDACEKRYIMMVDINRERFYRQNYLLIWT
jgi:hypothetical protein